MTCKYSQIFDSIIINGDSLEILKSFKDSSIDCVLTDPPYFIDGMGNNWSNDTLRNRTSKAGIVGALPVGMKFDPKQGIELQNFMLAISNEIFRILKPGGFLPFFFAGTIISQNGNSYRGSRLRDSRYAYLGA